MKKTLLTIFLSFVLSLSLFASSSEWALSSVKLGIGNDKYAYGLSRNDDDQLSYSEHISLAGERWYLQANLDGITNRGWKENWDIRNSWSWDDGELYSGRIDVTEIKAGINFTHDFGTLFSLRVSPETGFFLSGNTGYDFLQNTIHKWSGIHRVDLTYDYSDVRFHYYLGLNTVMFTNIYTLEISKLAVSLGANIYHAFGFESGEKVNGSITLYNDYSEILGVTAGWNWVQEHNSSSTMELYSRYINGPYAGYTINTGFFALNYFTELTNHFGYAVLSFDVMSLFRPTIWKENNIFFSMGFSKMMGLTYCDQRLSYPVADHWAVILRNRYVAGYPINKKVELMSDSKVDARLKQGHSMNTIGIEYEYPIKALKNWVSPYVSLGLGYMRWNLTFLTNMIESQAFPAINCGPSGLGQEGPDYSFVADAEAGITFIPEGLISFNSTSLTLSVFAGMSYVTGEHVDFYRSLAESKGDEWVIESNTNWNWKRNFIFRWGLLLNFGFDI